MSSLFRRVPTVGTLTLILTFAAPSFAALPGDSGINPFVVSTPITVNNVEQTNTPTIHYQLGNVNEWASLLPSPRSPYRKRLAKVSLGQPLELIGRDQNTGRVKVRYHKDGQAYTGWIDGHRLIAMGDNSRTDGGSALPDNGVADSPIITADHLYPAVRLAPRP